jgi:hypothetical protein
MLLLLRSLVWGGSEVVDPPVVTQPSNEVELRPKRYFVRKRGTLYIFNSAQDADDWIEADEKADKAIEEAQRTSRRARKRLRQKVASFAPIPLEAIQFDALNGLLDRYAINVNLPELIAQQDYERVMQIMALVMEMQEEDDIEMLLLM